MSCADFRELLSPHLDGVLEPAEEKSLAEHLAHCESCRDRLDEIRSVVNVVRAIPDPEPPVGLATEVMAKIPRRRKKTGKLLWLAPLAAAACLLLVVRAFNESADQGGPPMTVATERSLVDGGYDQPPPESEATLKASKEAPHEAAEEMGEDSGATYEADAPDTAIGMTTGAGSGTRVQSRPPADPGDTARAAPPLPGKPTAPKPEEPSGRRDISAPASRKYAVKGADPDTAAGVILAELGRRRDLDREESGPRPKGKSSGFAKVKAVKDSEVRLAEGEVAALLLQLTEDELEFVTALLCERPGVSIDRVNGHAKKRDADVAGKSATTTTRLAVELRFR